jgi:hypothetical protein
MKHISLKRIYLYFFSALGLILVIIASIRVIDLGLKTFIFTEADKFYEYPAKPILDPNNPIDQPSKEEMDEYQDKQRTSQRQRDLANSLSTALVGAPLYLYHWRKVRRLMDDDK